MGVLEKAMECLKPLVGTKAWDYCVVWTLGDDPSRFIEWLGCCCSGAKSYDQVVIKEERPEGYHFTPICRDTCSQHPVRTEACEALARLPSYIPLYSGIHGEVVVSSQPRWFSQAIDSDSKLSHEPVGTHVLIPANVCLVELFSAKQIPRDQKTIDYVMAQFHVSREQRQKLVFNYTDKSFVEHPACLPGSKCSHTHRPSLLNNAAPNPGILPYVTRNRNCPSVGSISNSNPSTEHTSVDLRTSLASRPVSDLKFSSGKSSKPQKAKCRTEMPNKEAHVVAVDGESVSEKTRNKLVPKSKNYMSERNRRNRIRDLLLTLRSLVPKISKMDKASTLGDAIDYIIELQEREKQLKAEIQEAEAAECHNNSAAGRILAPTKGIGNSSSTNRGKKPIEARVEVQKIAASSFLVNIVGDQKQVRFAKLMQAMTSIGCEVVDANVTTFHGSVLSTFKVDAKSKEMHSEELRDALIKLMCASWVSSGRDLNVVTKQS